jgi:hypothetical protein
MPPTVDGFLLLGWMEKEDAVRWLTKDCWFDPPLADEQAEEIWNKYRNAVQALPERKPQPPQGYPIPLSQQNVVKKFLTRVRGPEVRNVINIDPRNLFVYQFYVVSDKADQHAQHIGGKDWAEKCLQIDRPSGSGRAPVRHEKGVVKVSLPHAEHLFTLNPTDGKFEIQPAAGFISVCDVQGRMLLKAGYHRSFAVSRLLMNDPEAKVKSLLVAVTATPPVEISVDFPKQGLRTTVLGSRAPVLADFLDESLVMAVKLRKKRYEMHIKVDVVPIDET